MPGADWLLTNLEASSLPDASFDGVTVGATLNETRDPARFLAELERVLRPGGGLWLMYLARNGGPLQGLLSSPALGGLTFPDPAWVARRLCLPPDRVADVAAALDVLSRPRTAATLTWRP